MKPKEIIQRCQGMNSSELLYYFSRSILKAELRSGGRILDTSDFREWLEELAEELEETEETRTQTKK